MTRQEKARFLVASLLRETLDDTAVARETAQHLGIVFDGEEDWGPPIGVKWAFSKRDGPQTHWFTFYTDRGASADVICKAWNRKMEQFGLEKQRMGREA